MEGSDPPPSRKAGSSSSNVSGATAPNATTGTQPAPIPIHPRSNAPSHHRQSFADNLRNPPPSPRSQRTPSFTQQAIQDLLNHPPANRQPNPRFAGRDWRDVAIGELVAESEIRWAEMDTSVEDATMALVKNNPSNIVLIRDRPGSKAPVSTFDCNDLNSYLLIVVGLAKPDEEQVAIYRDIATRAQERVAIPLSDIQPICRKEDLVRVSAEKKLSHAIEVLGSGIHFVIVVNPAGEAVGVLSQLKILEFFWNEGVNFPAIDRLYGAPLRELQVGTQQIIAINADDPLAEALSLMHSEGLTSVAVVDHGLNVTGNISTADVRHLTNAASLPLLQQSCMHFISVILSERGVDQGRDSFPVFYVNPHSTLAHTVAKLVATRSHRMWVVESPSPSPSAPATPLLAPVPLAPGSSSSSTAAAASAGSTSTTAPAPSPTPPIRETTVLLPANSTGSSAPTSPAQPHLQPAASPGAFAGGGVGTSVPSAALPGAHLSGRLTGVVSLTDILNLFAKCYGLQPTDPGEQRARRRRSSSSQSRPLVEGARASMDSLSGSRR